MHCVFFTQDVFMSLSVRPILCSTLGHLCSTLGLIISRRLLVGFAVLGLTVLCISSDSYGYTPESPKVQKVIKAGIKYLSENGAKEKDFGGKCLVALALIKADEPTHKLVGEALRVCRLEVKRPANYDPDVPITYSDGLAIIFLCELDAKKYRPEIMYFLSRMKRRQKGHGGWGYSKREDGDTSQTQYGTLCLWEARRVGIPIDSGSVERATDWLLRTQDVSGAWAYQGGLAANRKKLRSQSSRKDCSMLSAGMGSLLICADMFGFLTAPPEEMEDADLLPDVLKKKLKRRVFKIQKMKASYVKRDDLLAAVARGNQWMDKNYKVEVHKYQAYYYYALERFRSFEEVLTGDTNEEPEWYNKGVDYLAKTQSPSGSWENGCGINCDTAYSILFLLRSTKKSINSLGDGRMTGTRGLPTNLTKARLRHGKFIDPKTNTSITDMLSLLDNPQGEKLETLLANPASLVSGKVDAAGIRRLQQLVHSGQPLVRVLCVKALSQQDNLDQVPTFIFALTDPDQRVVFEARNALRLVSRRFNGFGLNKKFSEEERYAAVDKWKKWYRRIRPDSAPLP